MSEHKDGGAAFPIPERKERDPFLEPDNSLDGMSLRDWFAGRAINLFSLTDAKADELVEGTMLPRHDIAAKFCYNLADAMIAERDKR